VIAIPLREIMPNTRQPRTRFDDAALDELAASIREHGVIQPIIVKATPLTNWDGTVRRYELIAGERRWRASERAGMDMVPAIIRDEASDTALIELALIENLQRADLTPLEEAAAFGQMQSELGHSYDQIGKRVGKSKGYVMNRMRLLRLDADLRDLVAERPDTLSHIIHLEKLSLEERAPLVAAVRDDTLALAEVRRLVEQQLRPSAVSAMLPESSTSFLRKNDLAESPPDPALGTAPFLRKNDLAHGSDAPIIPERDIARIRSVVQQWKLLPTPSPEARQLMLTALDGLLGDLEDVMRHIQAQDTGARS
jgi:ParB family chromosome partitioning protein